MELRLRRITENIGLRLIRQFRAHDLHVVLVCVICTTLCQNITVDNRTTVEQQ